jgi:tetratricopeptide (TPR) repeat protein
MEKDLLAGTLTGDWLLNLAKAYSLVERVDEVFPLVERAYREIPGLSDQYARFAWIHFWPSQEYGTLIKWMEKDCEMGRMTPGWLLKLALAYTGNNQFDKAKAIVYKAYEMDSSLKDGHIQCAWQVFGTTWPRKAFIKILPWMEKDLYSGRISSSGYLRLSHAYAAIGAFDKAMEMIDRA